MRRKFVLLALAYPGLKLLLIRKTIPDVRENHILPLQLELGEFAKYNSDERAFYFPNNSRLRLGYCDDDSDTRQYLGQEYDVIGFEEATELSEFQIKFILTCNRSVRSDFKPRAYYTCNPGGQGHQYIKRLFIDKEYLPDENPSDYTFIQAKVYDNVVLMDNNPEYVRVLESLPEELRKAHLHGDWDCFIGQFFPSFHPSIHVVEPFEVPAWWKKFRSLDYGQDMTACYWWAVSPEGQCFVYRELYESDLILSQAAEAIMDLTPSNERISYTVASPDLWNRRQETGASGIEIMGKAGLQGLIRAKHERVQGWRIVREHLKPYEVTDQEGNKKITAKLQLFSNCRNIIKNIPLLQYDKNKTEDAAKNPHEVTHGPESIRYGCVSRHPEFSVQDRLTFPPGTSAADIERIRSNMEFEKVYSKMQNRNKVYGGW